MAESPFLEDDPNESDSDSESEAESDASEAAAPSDGGDSDGDSHSASTSPAAAAPAPYTPSNAPVAQHVGRLSDRAIQRVVGGNAFLRGRLYARRNAVADLAAEERS